MEFLPQQNRRCEGDHLESALDILAEGKRVVIIGGGDTGADCLGTSLRQRALSVHQFEIMPRPPEQRAASTPWPMWPQQLRTETSHEEGGIRDWGINSVKFTGDENGCVTQLHGVRVGPPPKFGVALDNRGNVATDADYRTSIENIFAAGDMRRGQSLVVWAISEGRKAAASVDRYLATVAEPVSQHHRVLA